MLSRKVGEKVRLGKNIVVEVLSLPGDRVKLGFTAPPEVLILRDELPDEARDEPQLARQT